MNNKEIKENFEKIVNLLTDNKKNITLIKSNVNLKLNLKPICELLINNCKNIIRIETLLKGNKKNLQNNNLSNNYNLTKHYDNYNDKLRDLLLEQLANYDKNKSITIL